MEWVYVWTGMLLSVESCRVELNGTEPGYVKERCMVDKRREAKRRTGYICRIIKYLSS